MEGGMTRKRGYLWLTILLTGITMTCLAVQPNGTDPNLPPLPDDTLLSPPSETISATPASSSFYQTQYPKKSLSFELNTADSLDLVQLYNIGPVIARRILKYRSLLGGYVRKEQLREVYGIDSARYNDIAPHLTVDPSRITPIDINTADIDRLKRHPYLDYYQAKAIIRLREEKGAYAGVRDILNIPIIDSETFTRIEPYLICNSQPNK
jgi:DNA uptake protein ComE-like DNA-binding protein